VCFPSFQYSLRFWYCFNNSNDNTVITQIVRNRHMQIMLSNVNIYILQKIIGLHHHKKVYIHTRAYKNNCYLSHKHYPVSYASLTHRYVGTMRKTLDNSRCENCTNCEVQRTCECSMHCNIAADKHSRLTGLRFYVPHNKNTLHHQSISTVLKIHTTEETIPNTRKTGMHQQTETHCNTK